MQAVILNVDEGKQARADLEKEIKGKEAELMKKKAELDKLNKNWKDQAALLSEEARLKKQQEFQQKFMALRNDEMKFQSEIKRKEQMATQKIAVSVSKMVNDLAKARGYEMVFETNSAGLLYLKDPVDLTKEVIAAFDKKGGNKNSAKK
ncbi:MAG: OmpH family outer membrane protein [Pseudobacteriovorax sp.]|nr:OmpH family outer membrane protein [Pseudobacteriovorax sp.]